MNNFLDESFDHEFKKIKELTWLPWVGKNYRTSAIKTLILGESNYNAGKDDREKEKINERAKNTNHLRMIHQNNAIDFNGKSLYARNLEKAIFQTKQKSVQNAHTFWSSASYHNLVLRPMSSVKERPQYKDYLEGWKIVFDLFEVLSVDQCIMYGTTGKKIKSLAEFCKQQNIEYRYTKVEPAVRKVHPHRITLSLNNKNIDILFIRHPSVAFSWKKWGDVMHEQLNLSHFLN